MDINRSDRYLRYTRLLIVMISIFVVFSNCFADDNDNVIDIVSVTIPGSCSVNAVIEPGYEHSATIHNGNYVPDIGTTTFHTYCNDLNGFAIYAVGYSGDTYGNTKMLHHNNSEYDFNTGTASSGTDSNWAMRLAATSGTYQPTIHSDSSGPFSSYHTVPSQFAKVVSFASNTDVPPPEGIAEGSSFTSTYAVWVSGTQTAGAYTGKVRYVLVHPSTSVAPSP